MIPKFRAWLNIEECYGGQEMCEVKGWDEEGEVMLYNAGDYQWDEVILMQSTGLEDKNGVGVFEGDYLSWISFESHKEFKGEVVFSKGSFCMVVGLKGHDYKVPLHELSDSGNLMEVLGNIYENPELMEEEE